jgi:hypothetical protein
MATTRGLSRENTAHLSADSRDFPGAKGGVEGNREKGRGGGLRILKLSFREPKVLVKRRVDPSASLDPGPAQRGEQMWDILVGLNEVAEEDPLMTLSEGRELRPAIGEGLIVDPSNCASAGDKGRKFAKLIESQGGLRVGHPVVVPQTVLLANGALIANHAHGDQVTLIVIQVAKAA